MTSGAGLSRLEKIVLAALKEGPLAVEELCKRTSVDAELAKLALEELERKGLVSVAEEKSGSVKIAEAGLAAADRELPERRLLSMVVKSGGKVAFEVAARSLGGDFDAALSRALKNGWLTMSVKGGARYIVFTGNIEKSPRESLLEKLASARELPVSELSPEELEVLAELERENYVIVEGGRRVVAKLTARGEEEAAQLPPLETLLAPPAEEPSRKALVAAALAVLLALLLLLWFLR